VQATEVASQHRCGGSIGEIGQGGGALPRSLIVSEEEELVLEDGPAHIATKLVTSQRIRGTRIGEITVAGVHSLVAEEFKCSAVEPVGSGLGFDADHGARCETIEGIEVVGMTRNSWTASALGKGEVMSR